MQLHYICKFSKSRKTVIGQFIFQKLTSDKRDTFSAACKSKWILSSSSMYCISWSDANDPMRSIFNDCALKRASFLLVDFNLRETSFAVSDIVTLVSLEQLAVSF
ncbi:hypothetical protein T02_4577 [Trichinella nativa]|uniref:Uncharacterized protein n=1 Tax=Trichinella nativa TaxID=6335 RepID=A0A0V1L3L0_9BILA|nr:hypothetical protein T02_4577 [Trichinella nativa]